MATEVSLRGKSCFRVTKMVLLLGLIKEKSLDWIYPVWTTKPEKCDEKS